MRRYSPSRWLATLAASLFVVSLVFAFVRTKPGGEPIPAPRPVSTEKPADIVPLFGKLESTLNPSVLVLMPDERGVRGWISGKNDLTGQKVIIRTNNSTTNAATLTLGEGNTFFWEQTTKKNLPVTAITMLPGNNKQLTARTTLLPAPPTGGPTAFFVTDRSAYRPGHTLKFVAFLRSLRPDGEFEPIANKDVTINLLSQTKGTRATQMKLKADAQGRVTGEYTFSDADALDHYTLMAEGFNGDGRVFLGEYRKTKVGLKLAGEVKDGKLVVTFDARDYLDRPVKGTAATYTATVTRTAEPDKLTLNPDQFAKPESGPPGQEELDALPDDERLLTLANGVSAMTFAGFGSRFVSSREGTVKVDADGKAKLELDLHSEWLKGNHTVSVSGVFTDEIGRENRASGTFKLDPKPTRGVRVTTPKEVFVTGENIVASFVPFGLKDGEKPATTLIIVKLEALPATPWALPQTDPTGALLPDNTRLPAIGTSPPNKTVTTADGWKNVPVFDPVKRQIISAKPVVKGSAGVGVRTPGAYKLLAVTQFEDGASFESETGIVVKPPEKLPGVVLHLDRREVESGSRLTGVAHTRFAKAHMLLTLRDSQGIKLTKPLVADERGVARIDEALPANLRYGCSVCVQFPESATQVHADQRDLFVIPKDRTIGVTVTAPAEVGPGAEVKLGVKIDRQEEVDLIVSAFDESLLGVSGDLSKDIRDYFLADARGQARAARELAATRMGSITVADLVKKAHELLKDKDALAKDPGLKFQLTTLDQNWGSGKLTVADVVTLVRLTGLEVYLAHPMALNYPAEQSLAWQVPRTATLADLLRWEKKETTKPQMKLSISATVIGNVALVGVVACNPGRDPDAFEMPDPWIGHRGNPYSFGGPNVSFCGGFQCYGFGSTFSGPGFNGPGFSMIGFNPHNFSGYYPYGFGSGFGGRPFGAQFGMMGMGGGMMGINGGIAGFGGGALGGAPNVNLGPSPQSVAGMQGSFSHQPFVGGQMGMSFGFNRDFGPVNLGSGITALPGLGIANEMVRRDFADSAFWSAKVRTDNTGNATATFKLPDSLTNWRVQVTAVSPKMHVGTGTAKFKSTRSVMIWPMLPRTFTEGDTVRVFGTVHNLTEKEQTIRVHLTTENGKVLADDEQTVKVPANGSVPVYWNYRAGTKGFTDLLMSAKCDAGSDASLKKLPVTAAGIVERATASGMVSKGELKLTLPDDFDPARATATLTVAPTLAADLADTLPYLVDYPYGCVEQTMSRFLPALKVAHIVRQAGLSTMKQLEEKLPKVVEAGQKRLIELQQPDGGWGWNGTGTTHEMMTPYALYGLIMAEEAGYPCPNPHTIDRGLAKLKEYLDKMGLQWDVVFQKRDIAIRQPVVNDALFCLWVMTADSERVKKHGINLDVWFSRIEPSIGTALMSDTGHALALEIAVKHKKKDLADKLAAELRKRAKKSGDHVYWTTAGFSRWGDNTTEVTATVMKALVAHDPKDPLIPGILQFFHGTKRGDRWDSTKDTACVLYALCDYLAAVQAGPGTLGLVKVTVNGEPDGNVKLDSPSSKTLKLTAKGLKPGENVFTVSGLETTGGALARVVVSFTRGRGADIPAHDHGVKVERTIYLRSDKGTWEELKNGASVPAGSYLKIRVTASPGPGTQVNYTLLESPKPAGGETIPADDPRFPLKSVTSPYVLREDREAMTCFHYEQAPGIFSAEYVVLTEFTGEFRIAPARVELMYKPTVGGHSDSFTLKVTEKK